MFSDGATAGWMATPPILARVTESGVFVPSDLVTLSSSRMTTMLRMRLEPDAL
jgi:hypothetical protein